MVFWWFRWTLRLQWEACDLGFFNNFFEGLLISKVLAETDTEAISLDLLGDGNISISWIPNSFVVFLNLNTPWDTPLSSSDNLVILVPFTFIGSPTFRIPATNSGTSD